MTWGVVTTLAKRRRAWASALISRCDIRPPQYGSQEWLALNEEDPGKLVAVVIAAEAWACDGDELPMRLHREVEALSLAYKQAEDAEFVANAQRHKHEYRWLGTARHSRVAPTPPRPTPPPPITVHAGTRRGEAQRVR